MKGTHVIQVLSCSKELTLVQSKTKIAECIDGSNARAKSVDDAACNVHVKINATDRRLNLRTKCPTDGWRRGCHR
jgi:hypothetical protein